MATRAKPDAPASADEWGLSLDDTDDYVRCLYYGREGSAKTTNCASMVKLGGTVVYLEAEAGLKKGALRRRGFTPEEMKRIRVNTNIDYDYIHDELFFKIKGALEDKPGSIAGVALDSSTAVVRKLLTDVVGEAYDKAQAKAERQGIENDRNVLDRYPADYGVMTEQVRRVLERYRALPCHLAWSALERRDTDEDTGKVVYGPAVNPALQIDVQGWMDIVCYCELIEVADRSFYVGRFQRVGKYNAKDRFGALPRTLVDPTFDRVVAYVRDELDTKTDERQQALVAARKAEKEQSTSKKAA